MERGAAAKITVTLTWDEMRLAGFVGVMRQVYALQAGVRDRGQMKRTPYEKHITGAQAEMAWAKATGAFWAPTIGQIDQKDVGATQVRSTDYPNGFLPLHASDKDEDWFVLVIIPDDKFKEDERARRTFRIAGCITGAEGKVRNMFGEYKYWAPNLPAPCIAFPQSELRTVPPALMRGPVVVTLEEDDWPEF